MQEAKIQTGLRIPQERYDGLRMMAERTGVSLNAIILHLVDIGLSAISLGCEEVRRADAHIPPHSGERYIPPNC